MIKKCLVVGSLVLLLFGQVSGFQVVNAEETVVNSENEMEILKNEQVNASKVDSSNEASNSVENVSENKISEKEDSVILSKEDSSISAVPVVEEVKPEVASTSKTPVLEEAEPTTENQGTDASSKLFTGSAFTQGNVGMKTDYNDWFINDGSVHLVQSNSSIKIRASYLKTIQPDPDQRYILMGFQINNKYGTSDVDSIEQMSYKLYTGDTDTPGNVLTPNEFSAEYASVANEGTDYVVAPYMNGGGVAGKTFTFTDAYRDANKNFGIEVSIPTQSDVISNSERISVYALVKDTRINNKIGTVPITSEKYSDFEGVGKASITVKNSEITQGSVWNEKDNFVSAKNIMEQEYTSMQLLGVKTNGTVDTSVPGDYPVEYYFETGKSGTDVTIKDTAIIKVLPNKTSVNAHDTEIYTGDTWGAKDSFDGATDANGDQIALSGITVTDADKVDTTKAGSYPVTYSYGGKSITITVTVKENKTKLVGHDSTVYVGDKYYATDNLDSAVDKDGNPVDFADVKIVGGNFTNSQIMAGSYLILDTPGVFDSQYGYDGVVETVIITVVPNKTAVNVHDSTIYAGDNWQASDNFDSAVDKDGSKVEFSQVTVDDSQMDATKAGIYEVAYTYNGVTSTAKVTVKDNQTAVNVHDSTIYVGDNWQASDNFDSAVDKDGNPVDFANVTVEDSRVDVSKAGTYDVLYTYNGLTSIAKVTVKDSQTAVNVHDSTIYVGDNWQASDNFDSAVDKDGNPVDFASVTVDDSQVDVSKAGTYDVLYTYNGLTSIAKVTVKESQTAVNVHDSTIYVGDNWQASDNFDSAVDKDGNPVDFANVTVEDSQVDVSKAGTYVVLYTYNGLTSIAKVTVKESQTAVNVHDSTIYVGDNWQASDNFDSAVDKDGNSVDFASVTVDDSQVDVSKAGTYDVLYTYNGLTSIAKITVKKRNIDSGNGQDEGEKPGTGKPNASTDGPKLTAPTDSADKQTTNPKESVTQVEKVVEKEKQFPQTGESKNPLFLLVGLAFLSCGYWVTTKKRKLTH